MDVLSEVLRVIRLSGAVHFIGKFTEPWAFMSSSPDMLPARLEPGAESITPFHVMVSGSCWLSCGKLPPIALETGDVFLIARGDQHVMASDLGLIPVPIKQIYAQPSRDEITVLRHGGGGEETQFICGYLHSDQRFSPLLDAMPALVCIRVRNGRLILEAAADDLRTTKPITLEHEGGWWEAAINHLVREATQPGLGNRALLARLSELLFMEVLRWQLSYVTEGRRGWLAGLNDLQVGRVLTLLHAEPARSWTVEELAQRAAISRAGLAKRFVELVGETPMQYLTGWRMHLARRLLSESPLGLAEIASRVGYDSEAAFNRAFRRVVGTPPASWRQAKASAQGIEDGQPGQRDTHADGDIHYRVPPSAGALNSALVLTNRG
jgi:AraC family transcriptional regulator, alkane utilization regulator